MLHHSVLLAVAGMTAFALSFAATQTASASTTNAPAWKLRVPHPTINKKRWRKRLLSWWSVVTAVVFLTLAVGLGVGITRHLIQPGDIGGDEKVAGWAPRDVEKTMAHARRIIGACYAYRERYGRFPTDLEQLSPHFIPIVEKPFTGNKHWSYATYARGQAMYLSFAANHRHYPGRSFASGRAPPWSFDE